jgi:hypothetical protein
MLEKIWRQMAIEFPRPTRVLRNLIPTSRPLVDHGEAERCAMLVWDFPISGKLCNRVPALFRPAMVGILERNHSGAPEHPTPCHTAPQRAEWLVLWGRRYGGL